MLRKNRAEPAILPLLLSTGGRLLTDMTAVHTVLVQSQTSSGAAYQVQEQAMDSLTAKTQEFQTAFQSLSQNVLDSGILQFLTDIGTGAVSALDSITEAFGVIPTLAYAIHKVKPVWNQPPYTQKCV